MYAQVNALSGDFASALRGCRVGCEQQGGDDADGEGAPDDVD
jgi:hypothetical protein